MIGDDVNVDDAPSAPPTRQATDISPCERPCDRHIFYKSIEEKNEAATSFPCAVVASTIVTFMYRRAIGDDECSRLGSSSE